MAENISDIEVYETLKAPFGEHVAKTLVSFVLENGFHRKADMFATKDDIALVKDDIALVKDDIALVKDDIAKLRLATQQDIANTKVDLIKWMVGFWIAQMAAIIGLYLTK